MNLVNGVFLQAWSYTSWSYRYNPVGLTIIHCFHMIYKSAWPLNTQPCSTIRPTGGPEQRAWTHEGLHREQHRCRMKLERSYPVTDYPALHLGLVHPTCHCLELKDSRNSSARWTEPAAQPHRKLQRSSLDWESPGFTSCQAIHCIIWHDLQHSSHSFWVRAPLAAG